jgi:hypothetical protein
MNNPPAALQSDIKGRAACKGVAKGLHTYAAYSILTLVPPAAILLTIHDTETPLGLACAPHTTTALP